LLPDDPQTAARIFKKLLVEIARVKYYRPKSPRPLTTTSNQKTCQQMVQGKGKKDTITLI